MSVHYLDHNATSPLREECRAAMERALAIGANPSCVHGAGRTARATIERARDQVAALAGAQARDVIFTSGGTEANALALWGAVQGAAEAGARITRLFVSAGGHHPPPPPPAPGPPHPPAPPPPPNTPCNKHGRGRSPPPGRLRPGAGAVGRVP